MRKLSEIDISMRTLETLVERWHRFPREEDPDYEERLRRRFIEDLVIPQISNILREKFQEIEKRHSVKATEGDRPFVVHYTSLDTLFSVLTSYSEDNKTFLRMYDSYHLNDPKEGTYIELDRDLEQEEADGKPSHAYIASFVIYNKEDDDEFGDEDNLTYWLAYGRRGRGCSIMFPVEHNRFRRVLYGRNDAQRTANELAIPSASVLTCLKTDNGRTAIRTTKDI